MAERSCVRLQTGLALDNATTCLAHAPICGCWSVRTQERVQEEERALNANAGQGVSSRGALTKTASQRTRCIGIMWPGRASTGRSQTYPQCSEVQLRQAGRP